MTTSKKVTARTLTEVAKVADLDYTAEERRTAAASLHDYRIGFALVRDAELQNGEAPGGGRRRCGEHNNGLGGCGGGL